MQRHYIVHLCARSSTVSPFNRHFMHFMMMLVFAGIMRPKAAAPYAQAFAGSSEMKHDTK